MCKYRIVSVTKSNSKKTTYNIEKLVKRTLADMVLTMNFKDKTAWVLAYPCNFRTYEEAEAYKETLEPVYAYPTITKKVVHEF